MHGKRPLGENLIRRLANELGLSPLECEHFISKQDPINSISPSEKYLQLTMDNFRLKSDWYHYAILELMELKNFKSDCKWVARRLGMPVAEVQEALERLVRLGLVEIDNQGLWKDSSGGQTTTVTGNFTNSALKKLQKEFLQKAVEAIDNIEINYRDQSSVTFSANKKKITEAKEVVKDFRRKLATLMTSVDEKDEVYNLTISLFPLTQLEGENK